MPSPTKPILDTFTGTDVNPAPGWTVVSGLSAMRRASNRLTGSAAWSYSYYNALSFTVPMEFYVTAYADFGGGQVQEFDYLMKDAGGGEPAGTNANGYKVNTNFPSGGQVRVVRLAAGVEAATLLVASWSTANLDVFWIHVSKAGLHSIYAKHSADPDFTLLGSFTDSNYTNGRVILGTDGNGIAEWDDFGGGNLLPYTDPIPVQFGGVSTNRIVFNPGAITVGGAFTIASIIRPAASEATFRAIVGPENAGDGSDQFLLLNNANQIYTQLAAAAVSSVALSADTWYLSAVTKAAGSSAPRLHLYNFGTPGWTRENTTASASWSDTVAKISAGTFNDTSHPFEGFAAVYGMWLRALSDADLDGMIVDLYAWEAQSPDWWAIANGATPMIDETAGTGDEVSRGTGVTDGSAQTSPIFWGEPPEVIEYAVNVQHMTPMRWR